MKKKLLTLMTCIAMTLFIACNMKFCKSGTSDSEETKQGQPNSFIWYYDLCEYEGFFDLTKITKQQIQNAYSLCYDYNHNTFTDNIPSVHIIKEIKQINKRTLKELENAYLEKKKKLSKMELPKNEVWETFRQEDLWEMEQYYKVYKIMYEVWLDNEEALREFDKNDECLTYYSNALIQGGDALLSAWEHLVKSRAVEFENPGALLRYQEERDSEYKFLYGKKEILIFGWYNCANKHIEQFDDSRAMEEFKKLFTSIKEIACDEP